MSPIPRMALLVACALLMPALAGAADPALVEAWPHPQLLEQDVVARTLARNPDVESARAAWESLKRVTPAAGALANPMIGLGLAPLAIAGAFGGSVELQQPLPWPGKRATRERIAVAEAVAGSERVELVRRELALEAAMLWVELWQVARELEVNARHAQLVTDLRSGAEAAFASGRGLQQDALEAETELAMLAADRLSLVALRDTVRARLNALMHRAPEADLPPPGDLPHDPDAPPTSATLQEQALAARPELAQVRADAEAARARASLADLAAYPDFAPMTQYNSMFHDPQHRWMIGVAMDLPIWRDRIDADTAAATEQVRRIEHETARITDQIRAAVEVARIELVRARSIAALHADRTLPSAHARVEAARAGFAAGRDSFRDWIAAARGLRDAELRVALARADVHRRRLVLTRELGGLAGLAEEGARP